MNDNQQATQHTPGKWRADETEYSEYVFGPDGEMICQMRGWGYLTGERRKLSEKEAMSIQSANCKLIARAPDLEAENQRLRRLLKNVTDGFEELNRVCNDCHLLVTPEYNANVILIEDVKQALGHE